jgi:hypothetical protein
MTGVRRERLGVRSAAAMASLLLLSSTAAGCSFRKPAEPEFALIYNKAAQHHGPDRNPIIAIPGLLGSKLFDPLSGTLVWGAFEPSAASPDDPEGARLIALPIDGDADLEDVRDDVEPAGVLDKVRIRLLGVPLEVQAYAGILATLGAGGYRDEALGLAGEVDYGRDHFTCFQFDYDWRRDNIENAKRLHEFIKEKREYVRAEYKKKFGIDKRDIKFDIAAHSMGGLITRYFLMYGSQDLGPDGRAPRVTWEGAEYVERVVLIGTPNGGSPETLLNMITGRKIGPLLPMFPPALLGTFHSAYQLLPRPRHNAVVYDGDPARPVDVLDPEVWTAMGWGLADPDQAQILEVLMPDVADPAERRARALRLQRHVLTRARAFMDAMDRPATTPEGLDIYLVAGDALPTTARVSIDSTTGEPSVIGTAPGDRTVLRSSAVLDERVGRAWQPFVVTPLDLRATMFLPEEHLALTRNAVFRDNVLYWLLEAPR